MRIAWLVLGLLPAIASASEITADEIMARVAANQDRAQALREAYVYEQEVRARLFKGKNKLVREETRWYVVTPTPDGVKRELSKFRGRVRWKKDLLPYHQADYHTGDLDLDGALARAFSKSIGGDRRSRDGIGQDWFPLTERRQRRYKFHLQGEEEYGTRRVYSVAFAPKRKRDLGKEDEGVWKGEVLVDQERFQPVLIVTELAKGVPLWAKTVFGTNVGQVGFKLTYEEFDDGIWFPVSYGGEFKLRALFFYKRTIAVSMENRGFRRAEVESRVEFAPVPRDEP